MLAFTVATPLALRLYSASYLPLALIYVFLFARLFFGHWAALLAVFLGGMNLPVLESSRYFTLDAPLVLSIAGGLYHAARSRGFTRIGHSLGVSIKLALGAMLFPAFAMHAACGIVWLICEKRWKRLAVTLALQIGLAGAVVLLAFRINPYILTHLFLDSGGPSDEQGYPLAPLDDGMMGKLLEWTAFWLMGLLWMLRRIAWPMALICIFGAIWGSIRLWKEGKTPAFAGILLTFLGANVLYVWVRLHAEFERYLGPLLILHGILAVAAVALIKRVWLRRVLLGALAVYGFVGWAGPQWFPERFDCRLQCLIPSIQNYMGSQMIPYQHQYPLVLTKLWSEPAPRPELNYSVERIAEALRRAPRDPRFASDKLIVKCVCLDLWRDDSFYEYERLSDERFSFGLADRYRFELAKTPGDLIGADYILLVARGFSSGYTHALDSAVYRTMLCALEAPSIASRLRCRNLLRLGLPSAQVLTLYQHQRPHNDAEAMEQAVVWFEMLFNPMRESAPFKKCAQWIRDAGYPEPADSLEALETLHSLDEEEKAKFHADGLKRWGKAYARLVSWFTVINKPLTGKQRAEEILATLDSGPPVGAGLMLASMPQVFSFENPEIAKSAAVYNITNFTAHFETWQILFKLVPDDFPFDKNLAKIGAALSGKYYYDAHLARYETHALAFTACRTLDKAGRPEFLQREMERLRLMEEDHPHALKTLLLRAAELDSAKNYGKELESVLREAIGVCGGKWTMEAMEYELCRALGRCLIEQGKAAEGKKWLKKGGWEGVECLLDWERENASPPEYRATLRWALGKTFPIEAMGSDAVRMQAVQEFFNSHLTLAFKAFAQMNATPRKNELPIFQQLVDASRPDDLAQFEKIIRKSGKNPYAKERSDFYLARLKWE